MIIFCFAIWTASWDFFDFSQSAVNNIFVLRDGVSFSCDFTRLCVCLSFSIQVTVAVRDKQLIVLVVAYAGLHSQPDFVTI